MRNYNYEVQSNTKVKLDPRTKLLLMVLITTTMFMYNNVKLILGIALIPFVLLMFNKQYKLAISYILIFILSIWAKVSHDAIHINQVFNGILVLLVGLVMRLFPGLMMGAYVISSTKVSEFIAAMEKMHLSQNIIIPLAVMFRFLPTVREESRSIKLAMRMRGIQFGSKKFFRNPATLLEYRMVPLLTSIVKIGDELSAAALTRGLGSPIKRTNVVKVGFGVYDVLFLSIALILFMVLFL
ncbi:energy-coupling factor transporter transmembrane component T [Clostridiaceae bacterium M8S5]|nr:energy-coupling factor transporter transmembrane component T [Clostridiaceae bacterium M8S5]